MCWLVSNLVTGFLMKELGKNTLKKDLDKTLLAITLILLIYQGVKLAGSFFYLFKLGVFKFRIAKYNDTRMD
jgi:hypothetical protein